MAMGHHYEEHRHDEVVAEEMSEVHQPFGIAQIYAVAMGVFFIIIGAIALARAGTDSFTRGSVEVAGLGSTAMLALIHLGIGVISLACGVSRSAARSACTIFGAGLIALGIVALIEPVRQLGWTGANGAAYIIAGALALVAMITTPMVAVGERHVVRGGRRWVA